MAIVVTTDRLLIREIAPADRDAMLAVYGDADAMRWVDDGSPLTPAECDRWLEVTARNYQRCGLERVIATTAPENTASHRVLEKAGLHEEAPRRNDDGSWDRVFAIER